MPLPDDWRRAEGPQTVDSLRRDLTALGVRPGTVLLVHASLSSLGWVCGGATAVVTALLRTLGAQGTLVVPTMTANNRDPARWSSPAVPEQWWPEIRRALPPFDPASTPSYEMGAIAEQVRCWPGSLRSGHPQTSFAAVGPAAAEVLRGHDISCHLGERSPLGRLEHLDAEVLLIGVGYARCTCFHLAEYRQPIPHTREYSCVVADGEPDARRLLPGRWVSYSDVDLRDDDFGDLGPAFERGTGEVRVGRVGLAEARLFSLPAAVAFATGWIGRHRGAAAEAGG